MALGVSISAAVGAEGRARQLGAMSPARGAQAATPLVTAGPPRSSAALPQPAQGREPRVAPPRGPPAAARAARGALRRPALGHGPGGRAERLCAAAGPGGAAEGRSDAPRGSEPGRGRGRRRIRGDAGSRGPAGGGGLCSRSLSGPLPAGPGLGQGPAPGGLALSGPGAGVPGRAGGHGHPASNRRVLVVAEQRGAEPAAAGRASE